MGTHVVNRENSALGQLAEYFFAPKRPFIWMGDRRDIFRTDNICFQFYLIQDFCELLEIQSEARDGTGITENPSASKTEP